MKPHLYQVTLNNVNGNTAYDGDGNFLMAIGNHKLHNGDAVFSDGRYIYGHQKINNGGLPVSGGGVVPLWFQDGRIGYYDIALRKVGFTKFSCQKDTGHNVLVNSTKSVAIVGAKDFNVENSDNIYTDNFDADIDDNGQVYFISDYMANATPYQNVKGYYLSTRKAKEDYWTETLWKDKSKEEKAYRMCLGVWVDKVDYDDPYIDEHPIFSTSGNINLSGKLKMGTDEDGLIYGGYVGNVNKPRIDTNGNIAYAYYLSQTTKTGDISEYIYHDGIKGNDMIFEKFTTSGEAPKIGETGTYIDGEKIASTTTHVVFGSGVTKARKKEIAIRLFVNTPDYVSVDDDLIKDNLIDFSNYDAGYIKDNCLPDLLGDDYRDEDYTIASVRWERAMNEDVNGHFCSYGYHFTDGDAFNYILWYDPDPVDYGSIGPGVFGWPAPLYVYCFADFTYFKNPERKMEHEKNSFIAEIQDGFTAEYQSQYGGKAILRNPQDEIIAEVYHYTNLISICDIGDSYLYADSDYLYTISKKKKEVTRVDLKGNNIRNGRLRVMPTLGTMLSALKKLDYVK